MSFGVYACFYFNLSVLETFLIICCDHVQTKIMDRQVARILLGGGARQIRVGQIRVTTTYAHPKVVVILTVLDSKQDKMKTAFFLL